MGSVLSTGPALHIEGGFVKNPESDLLLHVNGGSSASQWGAFCTDVLWTMFLRVLALVSLEVPAPGSRNPLGYRVPLFRTVLPHSVSVALAIRTLPPSSLSHCQGATLHSPLTVTRGRALLANR